MQLIIMDNDDYLIAITIITKTIMIFYFVLFLLIINIIFWYSINQRNMNVYELQ